MHNPLSLLHETTSERPKVPRTHQFSALLTWKCASRHNGVHFFNISTSKSGPKMVCFVLGNVLCATTVHTFFDIATSKSGPNMVCCVRTWKCASRHNGVHFFDLSTFKSGPRMVCFARFDLEMCFAPQRRPTFHLSSDHMAPTLRSLKSLQKHRISRLCYPFSHLHLLSSDSFSSMIFSLLLFSSLALPTSAFPSVHIVGSLTSKLPSPIYEINKI